MKKHTNLFQKRLWMIIITILGLYTSYSFAQDCQFTGGNGQTIYLSDGETGTFYSAVQATYPQDCNDIATTLTCISGIVNGNYMTYNYDIICDPIGGPIDDRDLILTGQLPGGEPNVAQNSTPTVTLSITNRGQQIIDVADMPAGFIMCDRNGINIYTSRALSQFTAEPIVPQNIPIKLKDIVTQSQGAKHITCTVNMPPNHYIDESTDNNTRSTDIVVVQASRFDIAMERVISPIKKNLEAPEVTSGLGGAETIRVFVFKKVMNILVPLMIVIGILSAITGFYKLFFSSDENSTKDGIKYITFGVIGVIIIMSAQFISTTMYENILSSGNIVGQDVLNGSEIAQKVYELLIYPFIKLAIYLVLGVMFIILVSRVITFLFGSSDDAKKKAGTIIGRNIIAMLLIIGARQLVEAIYGKRAEVTQEISNLGEIGSGILADKSIPILYQVINRVMGLTAMAILIVIIFQTFQLLLKPDKPEQMTSIKNSLLYIFIGILIIGAGYLITNFLIINR